MCFKWSVFLICLLLQNTITTDHCSQFSCTNGLIEKVIDFDLKYSNLKQRLNVVEMRNDVLEKKVQGQQTRIRQLEGQNEELEKVIQKQKDNNLTIIQFKKAIDGSKIQNVQLKAQNDDLQNQMVRLMLHAENLNHTAEIHETKLLRIDERIGQLKETTKLIQRQIGNLNTTLEQFQLKESKSDRPINNVSFSARLGKDYKVSNGGIILFKGVLNNDGDAYNAQTGIFTATVAGKYWFATTITIYPRTYAYVEIMRNNVEMAKLYTAATNSTTRDTGSVSTVINLRKGDTVFCRWLDGSTSGAHNIYGTHVNFFSGVLLSEF